MLQPTTRGVIPFNFFAGAQPTEPTDLAWTAGYTYVITSIVAAMPEIAEASEISITDAEGNGRYIVLVDGSNGPYPQRVCDQVWIVLGPNSGAKVASAGTGAVVTIDGFALLPGDLPIW